MKYVFGPVPSRRLGQSLGVSPIPPKTCNYSCIYCQLGKTIRFQNTREMFFPPEEIIAELRQAIGEEGRRFDFVTFVGEGEPTLYLGLGEVIRAVKGMTPAPVAVITNGALLWDEEVAEGLADVDVVMPTFDAPDEKLWRFINRPHPSLRFEDIFRGMVEFRRRMRGEMWLEVMLMEGINDGEDVLIRMREMIDEIAPHKIFVGTPIRPPAEPWVKPLSQEKLRRAAELLGGIPLGAREEGAFYIEGELEDGIVSIVKRHPLRMEVFEELCRERGKSPEKVLKGLIDRGSVYVVDGFIRYRPGSGF